MNLRNYMKENIFFLDGGMGTLLQEKGLPAGELPERWNLTHADVITGIHRDYFNAGSNVVNANTFGANLLKFSEDELEQIIRAAIKNAQTARDTAVGTQPKWIALDIGPTGKLLKPFGDLDFVDAVKIFAATVRLGVKYGADLIFIETMNDSYETKAAVLAAKENCDLPVFVSNAYGEDGKLMTGATPEAMVAMLEGLRVDAIGVNCSFGPKALMPIVERYLAVASVPVLTEPNAGLPQMIDGKTVFDILPEEFSADVSEMLRRGVRIAGGCCGTTPAHLLALIERSHGINPVFVTEKEIACVSSYTHTVRFGEKPVLIGERINPTGKKRFKEALHNGDIGYILKEGIAQREQGADILDVNVGLPDIDEEKMLSTAVCELQSVIDLPLQLDTSDPVAMETALRHYNGKPLINSVNGKQESMDAVFPLAAKYGGMVVALTLDENGIPATADGRVKIAKKILAEAEKYGLRKKDLLFDPLALTVCTDRTAGIEALNAVRRITNELGCYTSLGVSNVSFGLPQRETVNSGFFAAALWHGLSAAIMNPYSVEMQKTYHAYCALAGIDENCGDYIAYAQTLPDVSPTASPKPVLTAENDAVSGSGLQAAIGKGLKDQAAQLAAALPEDADPLTIVQEEIIPALNAVGKGFEEKTVFLPQLLMSAEAAKAAFEQLKTRMTAQNTATRCDFVLATVKGDIHDIGKNIVRLLLENYGFSVTDLGKDVPPEDIVDTVVRLHAPVVGLSALMTTTVPSMEETIRQLRKKAPWCKVVVGGAVLNREYAETIGADCYAKDAMETVRYAERIDRKEF